MRLLKGFFQHCEHSLLKKELGEDINLARLQILAKWPSHILPAEICLLAVMQPALKAHSTTSKPFLGVCAEAQFNFFTKSFQFCTTVKFPVEFFSSEKRVFNAFSAVSFIPFKTTHIIKNSSNVSLQFWRENSYIFCTVKFLYCWIGFNLKNYRFCEAGSNLIRTQNIWKIECDFLKWFSKTV